MRAQTACYSADQQAEAMHVLTRMPKISARHCRSLAVIFHLAETDDGGIHLSCAGEDFLLPAPGLRGPHQLENAGLAAACLFDLAAKNRLPSLRPKPTANAFASGIQSAVWPGRVQPLMTACWQNYGRIAQSGLMARIMPMERGLWPRHLVKSMEVNGILFAAH
jgi:folylpolyglutamate synthase/dihydropteroate synthase